MAWLLPATPDARLTHLLKTNTTISRLIEGNTTEIPFQKGTSDSSHFEEWRRKWQVGSQWLDADVDELYQDLHDIHPHVGNPSFSFCLPIRSIFRFVLLRLSSVVELLNI